ncbi:MAG: hypothetical protein LBB73_01460 [Dysgonamonadaceae bacterium]|nr:hypothetical protein [Dysgonamonadaceae bacterium]
MIFLFLLLLMVYGAVNVKAQVRIGSDSPPDPSAILDLNPSNNENAAGGVLLPRVRLNSETDKRVFGGNINIAEGIMVYNLNPDNDSLPSEGIYCYNGDKWVPAFSNDEVEITIKCDTRRLWLGNKQQSKTLKVTVTCEPAVPDTAISYEWVLSAPGYKSKTIGTNVPEVILASADLEHTAYSVLLTVKYHWTKKQQAVATVAVGPGAWIGDQRWLKVANTNLGALDNISLDEQLKMEYGTEEECTSLGYLFQWASIHHRSERKYVADKQMTLPTSMYNLTNGQPDASLDRDLFIIGTTTGDWRYYYASSIPKKWLWNTNPEPDGTPDPCRRDKGGRWRVPTEEDWHKIALYQDNKCELMPNKDGNTRGGIKVLISGEPSFFLPMTKILLPNGQLSPNEELGYWLNDDSGKTDFSEARAIGKSSAVTDTQKAYGLNIRCVADY